jgi:hypothetical protein
LGIIEWIVILFGPDEIVAFPLNGGSSREGRVLKTLRLIPSLP